MLGALRFPIQYLEVTEALVRSRDGNVAVVRERCGLPPLGSGEATAWIDGHQLMTSVTIALANCLPDEPPSLQILRHFPLTAHGLLGVLAMTSATVEEALDAALTYQSLVMPLFDMRRQPNSEAGAHVRLVPVVDFSPHNELMAEVVIGALKNVAAFTSGTSHVLLADFAHKSVWPEQAYAVHFGLPPRFGAPKYGFTVPHTMLKQPLITGNKATRTSLERQLQREAANHAQARLVTQYVRHLIQVGLSKGAMPNSEDIAHAMAMSVRTLGRRLQEEGQTWSELAQRARIERAEYLLQDGDLDLLAVARQSGFADASSFSRAFKRATGLTPAVHRAQKRRTGMRKP